MTDDGGPAFPCEVNELTGTHVKMEGIDYPCSQVRRYPGLSLRDYFAAAALQGICANPDISGHAADKGYRAQDVRLDYAASAYAQADAMIAEREKAR